ncbi:Z1 domain-containing protein [Parafrigoribacterium soli]|uniref:Z1 domain-containing protein n=1 Tax=Parafrigoribacterium soli TaxID=3144663 RepID=UPI0032EE348E
MTVNVRPLSGPSGEWTPSIGSRTTAFIGKKTAGPNAMSPDAVNQVLEEATDILSHCVAPTASTGANAVLVVGYVQSGKTLSFTTVASLARDNGYGLVVVLAGTTNNLKGQSEDRLEKDLGLDELQRDWRHFDNPESEGADAAEIRKILVNWDRHRQGKTREDKPAVLVTVLKHAKRLSDAAELFEELKLTGVPVLVIDDESDQAGLNIKARQNLLHGTADESGTYGSIVALRRALPLHSYLQYTATPQANLLLSTTDVLNPSFTKVISAGQGYAGGSIFFVDRRSELIVRVPDTEIFDPANPFPEPPPKLQEALQVFVLAIAAGAGSDGLSNRSMMVQAHQNTAPHALYAKWVQSLLKSWSDGLNSGKQSAVEQIHEEFQVAYGELGKTVGDLPSLEALLMEAGEKIDEIKVVVINSTADAVKKIKWKSSEYWVLVGGLKLDRGFTVEGLTVTYIPRRVSANADVLQQRGRFFGYREGYIDYCRVYMTGDSINAFADYVEDEEFLRKSLLEHEGRPMTAWRRDFILNRQLSRPTRAGVVGRRVKRLPLNAGWTWPKSMHVDAGAIARNSQIFNSLRASMQTQLQDATVLPGVVDRRTGAYRHEVRTHAPLGSVIEFLLQAQFPVMEDSLQLTAINMALGRYLAKRPDATGTVVFMSEMKVPTGPGRDLEVLRGNIFVGMTPNGASGSDVIYSGDRTVFSPNEVTVQLRLVKLSSPPPPPGDQYSSVPWLAVHFPKDIAHDAWLEDD